MLESKSAKNGLTHCASEVGVRILNLPQPESLENIFGAIVNQGTLEEAALWMAELAQDDPQIAHEFARCLEQGIEQALSGDKTAKEAINMSGYRVNNTNEAATYCRELLLLFCEALAGES